VIQKIPALLQLMSCGVMDLAPLFNIIGMPEGPLFLLLRGLLAAISTISSILTISPVSGVELSIILLP
jgi:hypothetical protein